jgi:tRNA pseudouridine55 synthase
MINQSGFLLINKPIGITSFDIIRKLRKKGFPKKMGHAGTLDPFASGLMIVAVGEGCKFLRYLELEPKVYHAKLRLGVKTDTLDHDGEIIEEKTIPDLSDKEIKEVLISFLGESYQTPPMFSAKKIKGKKLYELAREGIEVDRKEVKINISDISFVKYENSSIEFKVNVSSGTYIRSLADDIASKLNTCGHLIFLKRISLNQYKLDKAKLIDDISESSIIGIKDFLNHIPKIHLSLNQYKDIFHGRSIDIKEEKGSVNQRQLIYQDQFIGIGEFKENKIFPKRLVQL